MLYFIFSAIVSTAFGGVFFICLEHFFRRLLSSALSLSRLWQMRTSSLWLSLLHRLLLREGEAEAEAAAGDLRLELFSV